MDLVHAAYIIIIDVPLGAKVRSKVSWRENIVLVQEVFPQRSHGEEGTAACYITQSASQRSKVSWCQVPAQETENTQALLTVYDPITIIILFSYVCECHVHKVIANQYHNVTFVYMEELLSNSNRTSTVYYFLSIDWRN